MQNQILNFFRPISSAGAPKTALNLYKVNEFLYFDYFINSEDRIKFKIVNSSMSQRLWMILKGTPANGYFKKGRNLKKTFYCIYQSKYILKLQKIGLCTPLFAKQKFLGLGNHVREFGSPPYLRLLKTLYIDFSSQKPHRENSLGQSRSRCQIL